MDVLLIMSIFYCVYGVLGLFGLQVIPDKYTGKNWTKKYIRYRGTVWVLIGVPWLVLYIIYRSFGIDRHITGLFMLVLAIPAIVYEIVNGRKFKKLLKSEKE